ncbi:MAG: FliH/SctL family protein [bacterium]|nr:FliH/SctL family protein [bacterium]
MENQFLPPQFEDISEDDAPQVEVMQSFGGPEEDPEVRAFEPESLITKSAKATIRLDTRDASKFTSNAFVEEGSLLTNVEEYSKRIRSEADRQAKLIMRNADLALSEAEETLAHAQIRREEAEKDALAMVEKAEASVEEIERAAYEVGHAKGYEAGLELARKDSAELAVQVTDLLAELKDLRITLAHQHETEIVQQTLLMAKKVVHEELKTRPEFVLNLIKTALKHFEGLGKVRITVHPVEYDFLAKHKPELEAYLEEGQYLTFRKSESVSASGPVVETDFARVQMDLNQQFEEIERVLGDCLDERRSLFDPHFVAERNAEKAQGPATAPPAAPAEQAAPTGPVPNELKAPPEFDPSNP